MSPQSWQVLALLSGRHENASFHTALDCSYVKGVKFELRISWSTLERSIIWLFKRRTVENLQPMGYCRTGYSYLTVLCQNLYGKSSFSIFMTIWFFSPILFTKLVSTFGAKRIGGSIYLDTLFQCHSFGQCFYNLCEGVNYCEYHVLISVDCCLRLHDMSDIGNISP